MARCFQSQHRIIAHKHSRIAASNCLIVYIWTVIYLIRHTPFVCLTHNNPHSFQLLLPVYVSILYTGNTLALEEWLQKVITLVSSGPHEKTVHTQRKQKIDVGFFFQQTHFKFCDNDNFQLVYQILGSTSQLWWGERPDYNKSLFFSYLWRSYSTQGGWSSAFSMLTNI